MMTEDERLARLVLLWIGKGNPRLMHLYMASSNPIRDDCIKDLAEFGRWPDIAAQLPDEKVLPFFLEQGEKDADSQ